ncbi:MAG: hypothetical protein D6730_06135 [Bacteroidetes bacterium]|nr:MAG: hypothetical protein D6730_06135 [Bacteroidota bacterium]
MNIRQALQAEHSKAQIQRIVDYIGEDAASFDELMQVYFEGPAQLTQRAAWAMQFCARKHPPLVTPYLPRMLAFLRGEVHDAVKRNTFRLLEEVPLPEPLWGEIADLAFACLQDPKTAVAIRCFAMSVLYRIVQQVPELGHELRLVIEANMPYGEKAFLARGRKILRLLDRQRDAGFR